MCPRCRRPIVVRRVNGLRVLLTKDALDVFNAEREREANERTWLSERRRWLALARSVAAPDRKIARLESAKPSAEAVGGARELYLSAVAPAVRAARRTKRWAELARIRRDQAAALYRAAGSPIPPPDEILTLHREWSTAALRAASSIGLDAELVSGGCCSVCNKDDGKPFRISVELRNPRLPHAGCPKGLCACDWYPLPDTKTPGRRGRKKASKRPAAAAARTTGAAQVVEEAVPAASAAEAPGPEPVKAQASRAQAAEPAAQPAPVVPVVAAVPPAALAPAAPAALAPAAPAPPAPTPQPAVTHAPRAATPTDRPVRDPAKPRVTSLVKRISHPRGNRPPGA